MTRKLSRNKILARLLFGLLFSTGVALMAYRRRSLNESGVVGAVAAGSTTVGFGGWSWGLSLIFFFVSSSAFSHFRERDKTHIAGDKFSKGSRRDIWQVAANGGTAIALAALHGAASTQEQRDFLRAGYTGALAAATADTWATELGVLSRAAPRSIVTGKLVEPGTSGGVSIAGTVAAACGALVLGVFFWAMERFRRTLAALPLISICAGLAGSMVDSLLGATLQCVYYCPLCETETERRIHRCGTATTPLRGLRWLNNDGVNLAATLSGSSAAILLHTIIRGTGRKTRNKETSL